MVCESWKSKLDAYIDGELPPEEMRTFDAHIRNCSSCSAEALAGVQLKRAVHVAGRRYAASADFRQKLQKSVAQKPKRSLFPRWIPVLATVAIVFAIALLTTNYLQKRSSQSQVFSEIADLHVSTLASSTPVDVISTDRHTVKPWFQGKIPFAFNLPELQNTEFALVGGRMTYLDQAPGAHLIYDYRKHHISVFVFQERSLPVSLTSDSRLQKAQPFTLETWDQNGLRYFAIGDAGAGEIDHLAKLFQSQ
jgi:anti-sigma factor RsiW